MVTIDISLFGADDDKRLVDTRSSEIHIVGISF